MAILSFHPALRTEHQMTINRIVEVTNILHNRASTVVENLIETGLVEGKGSSRGREYLLSSKVYQNLNNSKAYVLRTGIDSVKYPELVLKLVRQGKKGITRSDVSRLLNLSNSQAFRLLKKLVNQGQLRMEGDRKSSRYYFSDIHQNENETGDL